MNAMKPEPIRQGRAEGLFHQLIREAEQTARVDLPHGVEGYLVMMLLRHLGMRESDALYATLATRLLAALRAGASGALRETGDACLMLAGLFPEQARRRHVSVGYFIGMGKTAYASLADAADEDDLFAALCEWFPGLVEVLHAVRRLEKDLDAMSAYETWQHTGSQAAAESLGGMPVRIRQERML